MATLALKGEGTVADMLAEKLNPLINPEASSSAPILSQHDWAVRWWAAVVHAGAWSAAEGLEMLAKSAVEKVPDPQVIVENV